MTFLPPDPPMDGSHRAAKVAPESVLVAPRLPVTRWNRRYLLAGAGALAALVAAGFYIGFGGAHARVAKQAPAPAADVTPSSPAISDRYAKGYADPTVQAIAPGGVSLPPPGGGPAPGGPVPAAQPPPPVDPAVQQVRDQALAARSANPFFAAAPIGEDAAPPAAPVSAVPPLPAPSSPAPAADVQPANGQGGKRQFLAGVRSDDYLTNPLRARESPWEVKAG